MDATSRRWCHARRGARWRPAPSLPRVGTPSPAVHHGLGVDSGRTRPQPAPRTSSGQPRPVRRRGEFFTVLERSWRRRREIAVSINAPLRDQGPGLRERDSALGCLIRPPGGARRLEELGPMFSPFSAPRRSFSTKERPRSRFLEGLRRPRPGFGRLARPNPPTGRGANASDGTQQTVAKARSLAKGLAGLVALGQ